MKHFRTLPNAYKSLCDCLPGMYIDCILGSYTHKGKFLLCRYAAGLLTIKCCCPGRKSKESCGFKPYICKILILHQFWRIMRLVFPRYLCNAVILQLLYKPLGKNNSKNSLMILSSQRSKRQESGIHCNQQSILLENFKRSLMT